MKINNSYNPYSTNIAKTATSNTSRVKEYSNYLQGKYNCLTPGKNASVSITSGLLRKAMSDEKTGSWLERELAKAPDYIEAAQRSAAARGDSLKFVSIEFGEEYTTMTTMVVTDCDESDSDIDKWLDRVKKKRAEQKEAEKKNMQKKSQKEAQEQYTYKLELKGKNLDELNKQFAMELSKQAEAASLSDFDMNA